MKIFCKANPFKKSIFIFSAVALNACATSQKAAPEKKPGKYITQKSSQGETKAQKKVSAKMQSSQPAEELISWTIRMSSIENVFTVKDRQFAQNLPSNPKSGTLAEAAVVIGILRDVATPPGSGPNQFQQVDRLEKNQKQSGSDTSVVPVSGGAPNSANTLESRCREKGVDLVSAISMNGILKTSSVYTMVWNAAIMDGNSEPFKQNVTSAIKAEAMLWQEIAKKVGLVTDSAIIPAPVTSQPAEILPTPSPTPTGIPSDAAVPVPTISDIEAGKIMATAQEAAVSENFEKAVTEIAKIPPSYSNYEIAQENMRQWSNRAVTDLRKKAAFDYRTAASMTDNASKKAGLMKAKGHLETALKKFSAASNLDTVRDNLKMIDQELEKTP